VLTRNEAIFATAVGGGLLAVSISQASTYLWHLGSNPLEHIWLVGMVIGALLGSQILIRLAILNWKSNQFFIAFLCIIVVMLAERFSFVTTEAAMQSRAQSTIRAQNLESPEYRQAMQRSDNYQRQLNNLMSAYNDLPPTYATKRENIQRQIDSIGAKLERAQKAASSIDVSLVGKSLGDKGNGLARLIAFVQCAMPITINIATIMLVRGRGGASGKKSNVRPLRASSAA